MTSVLKVLLRILSWLSSAAVGFGLLVMGLIVVLWLMKAIFGGPEISDTLWIAYGLPFFGGLALLAVSDGILKLMGEEPMVLWKTSSNNEE